MNLLLLDGFGERTGGDRPRGGARAPARGGGRALPVLAHGRGIEPDAPGGSGKGCTRRAACIALAALLAGCAGEPEPPAEPEGIRELVVPIPVTGQPARSLVEDLAANCWLGLVGGANLLVDRATGRVLVVSDSTDLLVADFLPDQPGESRVRLSGPALAEPGTSVRLVESLDAAVKTGLTTCPPAG